MIAAISAVGYYLAAMAGLHARHSASVISYIWSYIWPPNALLLGIVLMTERRHWWIYLLAALPGHVLSGAQYGVPFFIMPVQFVGNVGQALLAAVTLQH